MRNIFWTQNTPTFESWSWIFFRLKKFFANQIFLLNFIILELIMKKNSAKSENLFWSQKLNFKWIFFQFEKLESQIRFSLQILFFSELIMKKISAKSENLRKMADYQCGIWTKYPRFFNFKWIFFHFKKPESQIFQNWQKKICLNYIWQNFQQNQRNFFEREVAHYHGLRPRWFRLGES